MWKPSWLAQGGARKRQDDKLLRTVQAEGSQILEGQDTGGRHPEAREPSRKQVLPWFVHK